MYIDTHAHIHFDEYKKIIDEVLGSAVNAGLSYIFCVGTNLDDSQSALNFVKTWQKKTDIRLVFSVGLHPHDARSGIKSLEKISSLAQNAKKTNKDIVAIGECGLDYYKEYSTKKEQLFALEFQMDLAGSLNLPMIWHVREAFDDFLRLIDKHPELKGVVHSFTSTQEHASMLQERGIYIGLNGIMTFTKDAKQLEAARSIPLEKVVLETDSPFLTPTPKRGTINTPANVEIIAKFLAELRQEDLENLAESATRNAKKLFNLD
jgi:TatD DNase family protein